MEPSMYTHEDLAALQAQSLKMQGFIRRQTFSPEHEKTLRRFSSWEVSELIFKINQSTFRGRFAADPDLPSRPTFGEDKLFERLQRIHGSHQELGPRVLIASMSVDSLSWMLVAALSKFL